MAKSVVLMILDGWGIGEKRDDNPIFKSPTPTFDWMKKNFPSLALQASGISVGLPWGEVGTSESGHLTLGAGRILYQHYPRITLSIRDGSFFKNKALLAAFEEAKKTKGRVHLLGIVSSGKVHAAFEHLGALLRLAKDEGTSPLIHVFTDGRDSPPKEASNLIEKLESAIGEAGGGRIASISGRFYALDRDENWPRTEKVFRLLTRGEKTLPTSQAIIDEAYDRDLTDEFIEPSLIGSADEAKDLLIRNGDSLIFFNFREDSMRQLAQAFGEPSFSHFQRSGLEKIFVVTMTQYAGGLDAQVAFPKEEIVQPLGWVLAESDKRQLRLAESEKSAHVTFFFNGLKLKPFSAEYWVIVPSPRTFHLDQVPELSSQEIMNRLIQSMEEKIYDFILVNFANPDLIAHTGNFDAALKVVEIIDKIVNRISQVALKLKIPLIITSDHGNIESMLNPLTGRVETKHDPSPVPFYLVDQRFLRERSRAEIEAGEKDISGGLDDVAPTILELMGLAKPDTMTGQSLLKYCK